MEKNVFALGHAELKEIAVSLHKKVEKGLKEENTEVQCIPTYINPKTSGIKGKSLVLDLGGTNYRVATVDFNDGSPKIHPQNGWKTDLSVMKTKGFTQEQLFKAQGDPINETKRDEEMPIGYCFSYPAESLLNGDAKLLRWTKGVDIKEMIGKPVGNPFMDYLNAGNEKKFTGIKVINDTIASLFAGLTDTSYDAYIGLIVGTGTNMATFIHSDKITKLNSDYGHKGLVPINLESGNFVPPYLTSIDDTVDSLSANKGAQRFEKAVSGMYLGEILKAAFPLNEFEDHMDARKLTTIIGYPDMYKEEYVAVARWIYERSAKLVAASLAGLVSVLVSHDASIKNVRLVAEGSLFWSENRKGDDYQKIVEDTLRVLMAEMGMKVKVRIDQMSNANLIGTAIAALS
ncbi:MAG: hexokinase [Tannerellaceae bacterium]|jgi:hexokinase|nr:hexokinase [Tannerellaceae bacterium]